MKFENYIIIFAFYFFTENLRSSHSNETKRIGVVVKKKECKIFGLFFQDCDLTVSRFGNERFKLKYNKTCNIKEISFIYHFGRENEYSVKIKSPKSVLTVSEMKKKLSSKKRKLVPGTHFLRASMVAKTLKNKKMKLKSEECKFYVRHENATAFIRFFNKVVPSGRKFIVDASRSVNNDLEEKDKGLEYKWRCRSTNTFCRENRRKLGTESEVVVPAKYATQGDSFNFTAYVRSIPTDWQSVRQFVRVDDKNPFSISCMKHCGKYPNTLTPNLEGYVAAHCDFSCNKYDIDKLLIAKLNPNAPRGADFWDNEILKPHTFKVNPGEDYCFSILEGELKDRNVISEHCFRSLDFPKLTNCKAIPPKGNPFTKFKVQCDYDEKTRKYFEVRVESGDTVVYSTTSSKLDDIEFLVSRQNATIVVKLEDTNDVYKEEKVPVEIEPLIKKDENVSLAVQKLKDIYGGKDETALSIKEMIENGDNNGAIQMIDVVARELANVKILNEKDAEIVKGLKKDLLDRISDIPLNDISISKSVSGVVKLIAEDKEANVSDSEMAKVLAATCKDIAKQQLYLVQNDIDDSISGKDNTEMTNYLMSCSESEMTPYYELFKETAIDIEITTKFPINENLSEKNFEDYPQYAADDVIEKKVDQFLSAANIMVGICQDMASSMVYKQTIDMFVPEYVLRGGSMLSWMKSTGSEVADATFKQFNVTITPTPLLNVFSSVSMTVCTYTKDPFWSASEHYKIPTNVIDVNLRDEYEDEPITDFYGVPMNISFNVSEHLVEKKVSKITVKIPNKYSEFKEDEFTIVTIKAREEESFFVEFYDIRPDDHFEVVILDMERPQLKDFEDFLHVNIFNKKFFIPHHEKSDKWFLLAIRPHRTLGIEKKSVLTYSVYTPKCVSWNSTLNNWKFACSVYFTTTADTINCRCLHLSTLAGSFEYNELQEHPEFTRLDFELEEARSLFYPLVTSLLLLVYFFLLLYSIQKNETIEDAVYLMSDVPAENRFAYLVVVKTGARIHSGTSSDIVIRLIGEEYQSQEHVINFPDPLRELLQRKQEDHFVLATPVYLGKLEKIQVWFDCSGMAPTWFCKNIRICDMETKEWYLFKINKWFKIDGKPRIFMSVTKSNKKESARQNKKMVRLLNSLLSFGSLEKTIWHLSTNSTNMNFAYPKRLTLILSIMLTLLSVSIELHGRPEIIPRDSITPKCFFNMDMDLFVKAIIIALITYFPHLAIMEGFKNSRLQFQNSRSRNSQRLPKVFTVIFWCILILNIILLLHYILIFGYSVIQPKTMDCIVSSVLGLLLYVFVIEYIYNFLAVLLSGPMKTVRYNYEKILKNVEEQRRVLYKFIGRYIYRPILTPMYEIMSNAECMRKKIQWVQKREMVWQVHDFFIVVTFILLLYIIVLGEKDAVYDYRGHLQAQKLAEGVGRSYYKLDYVTHLKDFEDYMEKDLIPSIQSYQWYGKYVSASPGMVSDATNKYMGVIRLRQHRVEDDTCVVLDEMKFLNVTCKAPNYFFHFDSYNYTPAWNTTIPEFHKSRLGSVWGHQVGVGKMLIGLTGYYESGGYVAALGRTIKNSYINFNYLKRYNWIDRLTRAIVVEYCLYNVNLNLFHFVEIVLEKSATGYLNKEVTVQTERVVKHSSKRQKIALICCIFFMILILALALRTLIRIIKTKVWYKRDIWQLIDVIIVAMSFTWIGLFVIRVSILQEFAKHLEEKTSNAFVNYFPILNITDWMKILEGLLICLSTVRMWRILRFGVTFRTVEKTLILSANYLFIMGLYYVIFLLAFGIPIYVILGSQDEKFRNPYFVFKTLMLNSIGLLKLHPDELELNERGLGYAFYVIYSPYCWFFSTLFIAIIIVEYRKAREFALYEVLDYNLKDYTVETLQFIRRSAFIFIRKFRLKAGGAPPEVVLPKNDDLRYRDCVEVDSNRMKAMACVAKCVLLKRQKGLRSGRADQALMMRTVESLYNKKRGEREVFFIRTTKEAGYTVVDNKKILMIEQVVKLMLESPEARAKKMEKIQEDEILCASNSSRITRMKNQMQLMCHVVKNIEISITSNKNV